MALSAGGDLVHFEVSRAALAAEVRNGGAIIAQGGVVLLSASAKAALLRTVVNETGLVEAGSAVCRSAGRSRCRAARRAPWRVGHA